MCLTCPTALQEVCERESFKAECSKDEVIVVRRARYGRMREGRCITTMYGTIGCALDVLVYIDDACSGRSHCDVIVASLVPETVQPCPSDFRSYLEVAYECVKVAALAKTQCRQVGLLELRSSSGYLSSYVAEHTDCGSLDSPWLISVLPGQTIKLTLLDFGVAERRAAVEQLNVCTVYAIINEEAVSMSETLCGGTTRQKVVYTSVSNSVTVRIVGKGKSGHFLLRYEATGCPDLPPPRLGWIQRMGDKLLYGCNDSFSERRSLTCEGTHWSGIPKNCSARHRISLGVTPCRTAHSIERHTVQNSGYHWTSHRAEQLISLNVTPCRTADIIERHTMQDTGYHWTSHHAGHRISLGVTPCRTAHIIERHTVQNSGYHWTSHRAEQLISLNVTPCRTADIIERHTMQDTGYHWTSHHAGHRISLGVTPCRTAHIIERHTMQDTGYHWTSHHAGHRISLGVTPCRTAHIIERHTVQNSGYHWTSHRAEQLISLNVTPCRTADIIERHTMQDTGYHSTSHHAGHRISLGVTPCRTAHIIERHTVQNSGYHWTSHHAGHRILLGVTLCRTADVTGRHTMQDSRYHWTSRHAGSLISLDVTPCKTADITGRHTMQDNRYHL
ncbi:hypothetical protein LSAT2_006633 [Lamellibrachia satsuma]|nr:hypothetical protein LSAT2_006633 [Lamellibrachia satsuma]